MGCGDAWIDYGVGGCGDLNACLNFLKEKIVFILLFRLNGAGGRGLVVLFNVPPAQSNRSGQADMVWYDMDEPA